MYLLCSGIPIVLNIYVSIYFNVSAVVIQFMKIVIMNKNKNSLKSAALVVSHCGWLMVENQAILED